MSHERGWVRGATWAALGMLLTACSAETPSAVELGGRSADGAADELIDGVASGKADGWAVDEAILGGSYRYAVAAQTGESVTPAQAKILRFEANAGQAFAAVMRRADASELDAALILYAADEANGSERIAASIYDQALVAMGVESDAVVVHTPGASQTFLLYASDKDLEVDGAFQVDLIDLELEPPEPTVVDAWSDLDLAATDPALRAYTGLLRAKEPPLSGYVARGVLEEGADGYLVRHEELLETLLERAELRRFASEIDDLRRQLFDQYADTVGSDNPLLNERIGEAAGSVWRALRTDGHALP